MTDLQRNEGVEYLSKCLSSIDDVCSLTIVGSFRDGEKTFSDIDVIVIVENNSWQTFLDLVRVSEALDPAVLGYPKKRIKVNASLGPLKFDSEEFIVIHLMVYSRSGHREHVLNSPFTCYDWERYGSNFGDSLAGVFPVGSLQLSDFLTARRGISDYMADIGSRAVSYREYVRSGDEWKESKNSWPLDERHQNEFSYHCVKFIVGNFLKWAVQENRRFSQAEFYSLWSELLPGTCEYQEFFREIEKAKRETGFEYPKNTVARVEAFLAAYLKEIAGIAERVTRIRIFRHAKTELNDGRFLGQRSDPSIIPLSRQEDEFKHAGTVFSSPLRRAVESARFLTGEESPQTDQRLLEIDYGHCEGLTFEDLKEKWPEISESWNLGEDPRFPDGESQAEVTARIFDFLDSLTDKENVLVTHNVVIRCLLGVLLHIPRSDWFRIPVEHLEEYEVVKFNGKYSANLEKEQRGKIFDAVG